MLVALMGVGLKLDRPLAWATCVLTWRLLGIAMPLTIAALAAIARSIICAAMSGLVTKRMLSGT